MTREELIRNLKSTMKKHEKDVIDTFGTNISLMCKDVLDYLEQQPCEDCISRQAVLDGLASIAKVKARSDAQKSLMGRIMFFVEQLSPVTPKEKTGKWIKVTNGRGGHECDLCHEYAPSYRSGDEYLTKYCPNCGARMVSE